MDRHIKSIKENSGVQSEPYFIHTYQVFLLQWGSIYQKDTYTMLLVISPAKTLDYTNPVRTKLSSQASFLDNAELLIGYLRQFSPEKISALMKVSAKIAELNFDRYQNWDKDFSKAGARQALLAFKGGVYLGLDAASFTPADFDFAQQHLRIISGLYGLLRPLDLMLAYRLEMGTKLNTDRGCNLYEFWGSSITQSLNDQLEEINSQYLINLASNEYFKALKPKELNGQIITPAFKEYKNGEYKMIGVYAKKARGLLSRYIIQQQLNDPEDIKSFNVDGYKFSQKLSQGNTWVFARK
ncbi:MAG: peroxide stress protein YaaA [Xanthomonadales bacterium]|nr:peroxide stress protein YaaA [Xanthomonadales bacterium]